MATKITNVTTKMNVEETVNSYKFSGTVEVYNNQKTIKSINALVTKVGEVQVPNPADPANTANPGYMYTVSRGCSHGANVYVGTGVDLLSTEESDAILTAAIEFEAALNEFIKTTDLINI